MWTLRFKYHFVGNLHFAEYNTRSIRDSKVSLNKTLICIVKSVLVEMYSARFACRTCTFTIFMRKQKRYEKINILCFKMPGPSGEALFVNSKKAG